MAELRELTLREEFQIKTGDKAFINSWSEKYVCWLEENVKWGRAGRTELDMAMELSKKHIHDIENGDEIKLTDSYCLYKYSEEDMIVINEVNEWEEICQLQIEDSGEIIFEML